jgi:hypothetical protein
MPHGVRATLSDGVVVIGIAALALQALLVAVIMGLAVLVVAVDV